MNNIITSNDIEFSGFIMLKLKPIEYDWDLFISETCSKNTDIIIKPENQCHVTLVGKVYRNDLIDYYKKFTYKYTNDTVIIADKYPTFFDNDKKVCKFGISDAYTKYHLRSLRNEIFCNCRTLESYPNYLPHITIGYFMKNSIPDVQKIISPNLFEITGLMFSFTDNNNKEQTFEI